MVLNETLHETLQELLNLENQAQFISVYLDTSVNQEGKRKHWIFFKKRVNELEKLLEERGNHAIKPFREKIKRIEDYINYQLNEDSRGLALFIGPDYFRAVQLPVPIPNKMVVGQSPDLDVLIELLEENRHFAAVLLDQHTGRIFSVYLYDVLDSLEIADRLVPGRTKAGGWSQMRYQRHRKDHIQHFMKELAELLERFVRAEKPDALILLGAHENVAEFRKHLPDEIGRKILFEENVPVQIPEAELLSRIREDIKQAAAKKDQETANRLYEHVSQGYRAVAGLADTLSNLQMGKIGRLLISRNFSARGPRCSRCAYVFGEKTDTCSHCGGPTTEVDLRSEMAKLAERHKAEIEIIHGQTFLDSVEGIGGFLRF